MDCSANIYIYIYNITYHTITTYNITLCIYIYFITLNTQHVITFHYITLRISNDIYAFKRKTSRTMPSIQFPSPRTHQGAKFRPKHCMLAVKVLWVMPGCINTLLSMAASTAGNAIYCRLSWKWGNARMEDYGSMLCSIVFPSGWKQKPKAVPKKTKHTLNSGITASTSIKIPPL